MTPQEYFDGTAAHLRSMTHRAVDALDTCVYLAEDGSKCAVGYWIPTGHPAQQAEGTVDKLTEMYPDLAGVAWPEGCAELARELQVIHDSYSNWDKNGFGPCGEENLEYLAKKYRLTYTRPEA